MEKNNSIIAYILLAIAVIVIFCIITFVKPEQQEIPDTLDTSMFNVVNTKQVLEMLKNKKAQMIVIGSKECSATKSFVPSMQISEAKGNYIINYLELLEVDVNSEEYKEFLTYLEVPYSGEIKDNKENIRDYMGYTPLILIIKDKKVVYGSAGTMTSDMLTQLANTYGVAQ